MYQGPVPKIKFHHESGTSRGLTGIRWTMGFFLFGF
jgi:hypothetical protein